MNAWMSTGSAISFTLGKWLMTGGRIITSVGHIQHWIIRRHQSLQHYGEMENVKGKRTAWTVWSESDELDKVVSTK